MRDQRWLSLARQISEWKDYKGMAVVLTVNDKLVAIYQQPIAMNQRPCVEGTAYIFGCKVPVKMKTVERIVVLKDTVHEITGAYVDEVELT